MAIYKKLLNIQKAIKGLKKDAQSGKTNSAFGYQYVSGTKVLSNVREHMDSEGVILKTEVISCKNTPYTSKTRDGSDKTEMFTELEMRFTWIDVEDGSTDTCTFFANGMNGMEKGLGSAITYGERYFLLKYFHIQTDSDDIDNSTRKAGEDEYVPPKKEPIKTTEPIVPKEVTFAEKQIGEEKAKQVKEYLLGHMTQDKAQKILFDIYDKYHLKDLKYLSVGELEKLKKVKFDVGKIQLH